MRKQWGKYIGGGAFCAFFFGIAFVVFKPNRDALSPPREAPVVRKLSKSISALGTIVVKGEIVPIMALSKGTLARWLVKEGDHVNQGQLIGLLEGYKVAWQQLQRSTNQQTPEQLNKLRRRIHQLEVAILRLDQDAQQQKLSKELLESRRTLKQYPTNRPPISINQARYQLALAEIRAPISGQVLRILIKGKQITNSEPIIQLGQIERVYVIATLRNNDGERIRIGQPAIVLSPHLVEELLGKVEVINLGKQTTIQISLEDPSKAIALPDLKVRVKIR